jgi:hypothetical protein
MRVSLARHATATGLWSPDTTGVSAIFTRLRSGGAGFVVGVVDDFGTECVVVVLGAGLVGGMGVDAPDFADEPVLLHDATSDATTTAPTTIQVPCTGGRLRNRVVGGTAPGSTAVSVAPL